MFVGNTECCFGLRGGFLFEGIQSVAFDQADVFCLREYIVLFFTMGSFLFKGIQSVVFYQEEVFWREYRVLYLTMRRFF